MKVEIWLNVTFTYALIYDTYLFTNSLTIYYRSYRISGQSVDQKRESAAAAIVVSFRRASIAL